MPALPPDEATSHADAGDGVELSTDQARAGQRSGRIIWVLVIGLALVAIALFGVWGLRAGDLAKRDGGSVKSAEGATFNSPEPSPRQAPPGEPSTTGQTAPGTSTNPQ